MKKIYLLQVLLFVITTTTCFSSCSKDDNVVKSDGMEQTENLSNQDPEGTVVINMLSASKDNYHDVGISYSIHIDEANNFEGGRTDYISFSTVGKVNGLSSIQSIPTSGWAPRVAVIPGTGYVVRCNHGYGDEYGGYIDVYARLYVVESNPYGFTVKYQAPFLLPIKLSENSLTFTSEAGSKTIKLENSTTFTIEGTPEWCEVTSNKEEVIVSVTENLTATRRTGEIVLKNNVNSVTIDVAQEGTSSPKFQAGSGTAQDPYQIATPEQLKNISNALNSHFILASDIILNEEVNGSGWDPIGKQEAPFTGSINGQGHSISNMWMKRPTTNGVGLFGYISGASIWNINIEINETGITGGKYVGGICGFASGSSTIGRCSVNGNLTGTQDVGGLCGGCNDRYVNTIITECYSNGHFTSNDNVYGSVSGICGNANNADISNCYSTASLFGEYCYGISVSGNITKCYFSGKATPGYYFYISGTYTYYNTNVIGTSRISGGYNSCARTSTQMKSQSNYEGWDFVNVWEITEGKTYPTLRCFDNKKQEEIQQNVTNGGETSSDEAKGSGTLADPYNSVAANKLASSLAFGTESAEVYIKGKVVSIKEQFGSLYGNATFYISDDGTENGQFYVFRTLYLGNQKYTSGTLLSKGDEVVVYGKVTNYDNTPETVQNASYLYSLNGKTTDEGGSGGTQPTPSGDGGVLEGNKLTVVFGDLGITSVDSPIKLVDGTLLTFSQEDGKNKPQYHESTKIVRMYAHNSLTIKADSKVIDSVVLNYDTYSGTAYCGNEELYGEASGNKLNMVKDETTITFSGVGASTFKVVNNLSTGNSGGVQLRCTGLVITYVK